MARIRDYLRKHRPFAVLMVLVLLLTTIPLLEIFFVLGHSWAGIPPTFTDETFNYARVQTIVKGYPTEGNPYFMEHASGLPLVIFAGSWINAIPQLLGLSTNASLILNFIIWSLFFAAAVYWLFRTLYVPRWIAVAASILLYLESYAHVWRPVNLQPVYPFYFLWFAIFARVLRDPSRKNTILLGVLTGSTFYLFAYWWQSTVITLGLCILYALVRKDRQLTRAGTLSLVIGGVLGAPVLLYAFWLSHTSPYFWQSVARLGLVNTHLPMAEILYSGGWIGLVLAYLAVLLWRSKALRTAMEFRRITLFATISGLGLWVMQGSNVITGKLLETGEHVRLMILAWLMVVTFSILCALWKRHGELSKKLAAFSLGVAIVLSAGNLYYTYYYFEPFIPAYANLHDWRTSEQYAKPLAWLEAHESSPVVVWSDPHDYLATHVPIYTKHFTLYAYFGMLELVPEAEIRERYLVSQYFNNPSLADLKTDVEMNLYLGRHDMPHAAKTIERGIKICRALNFWRTYDCGTIPTPVSLLGDQFFVDLEKQFQTDIKPHIKDHLAKYHVSYILKDKILNPKYDPAKLGAKLVYEDDRYQIFHL